MTGDEGLWADTSGEDRMSGLGETAAFNRLLHAHVYPSCICSTWVPNCCITV